MGIQYSWVRRNRCSLISTFPGVLRPWIWSPHGVSSCMLSRSHFHISTGMRCFTVSENVWNMHRECAFFLLMWIKLHRHKQECDQFYWYFADALLMFCQEKVSRVRRAVGRLDEGEKKKEFVAHLYLLIYDATVKQWSAPSASSFSSSSPRLCLCFFSSFFGFFSTFGA